MTAQPAYWAEEFTDEERARLAPYVTNLDRPVFALRNLPETVKGALFARYSRSGKTLRRLFLDEFATQVEAGEHPGTSEVGTARKCSMPNVNARAWFSWVAQCQSSNVTGSGRWPASPRRSLPLPSWAFWWCSTPGESAASGSSLTDRRSVENVGGP